MTQRRRKLNIQSLEDRALLTGLSYTGLEFSPSPEQDRPALVANFESGDTTRWTTGNNAAVDAALTLGVTTELTD